MKSQQILTLSFTLKVSHSHSHSHFSKETSFLSFSPNSSTKKKETQSMMRFFYCISVTLSLFFFITVSVSVSESRSIVVDGVSEWKDPSVHVGDTVLFNHKYHRHSLYIFQNQRAFQLCNFTQATLLAKPNSTYTWHPSRTGIFYFRFKNESSKCETGMAIRVTTPTAPASAPSYPWPFRPKQASVAASPSVAADKGGGIPFINSNPAVPLPTGEVDSATITPFPISSAHTPPIPMMMMGLAMILWLQPYLMDTELV